MRCETGDLDRLRGVSNTLVLGPSVNEAIDEVSRLLLRPDDRRSSRVLVVTFVKSPRNWVDDWRSAVGDLPDEVVLVTTTDGFGDSDAQDVSAERATVRTEYVSSPGDLTGLGMVMGKYLERWYGEGADIRVGFDSLTTVLQYGEPQNVYRFLHLMTTRLDGADATAHFLLDPDTQDPQTVATLKSSFQAIVEHVEGDEWEVNQR